MRGSILKFSQSWGQEKRRLRNERIKLFERIFPLLPSLIEVETHERKEHLKDPSCRQLYRMFRKAQVGSGAKARKRYRSFCLTPPESV